MRLLLTFCHKIKRSRSSAVNWITAKRINMSSLLLDMVNYRKWKKLMPKEVDEGRPQSVSVMGFDRGHLGFWGDSLYLMEIATPPPYTWLGYLYVLCTLNKPLSIFCWAICIVIVFIISLSHLLCLMSGL